MGRVTVFHAGSNREMMCSEDAFQRIYAAEGWTLTSDVPEVEFPDTSMRFGVGNIPDVGAGWAEFRKKVNTWMIRVDGPFIVETSEGPLGCQDGWLAVDARGYPYPIAADEQELIYEPVESDPADGPPPGNGSRDAWNDYATSIGIAVPDGASRDAIKRLVDDFESGMGAADTGDAGDGE